MPFIGVLPERESLFQPPPRREVAVSDAAAWRLNPRHRQVYDKLALALDAGLRAAPCGVDPRDCGIAPDAMVFVKPIVNLAGMAVRARAVVADAVPPEAGSFWCERLQGTQTSSDCLVRDGRAIWFAHTRGSDEKNNERPIYWDVGVTLPALEPVLAQWVADHLKGYSGLCNLELIGGRPIEVHLRGSNGFFDFYGPDFLSAWVALVDDGSCTIPPPIPGGLVISVFGARELSPEQQARISALGVKIQPDPHTPDRAAILRCRDKSVGLALCDQLGLTRKHQTA
ncbi:hypothetical protein CCR95_14425 [Thiocystis minor]|uniref:hypothetical protein n=1 Tax=Thiocystis minor TaxID=61597 RepID=UPI001911F0C1|nr:hypothetical protein [Thiocystis minor]MBK5965251.1 hypothetical protein [Thiocystis minor]